MLTRKQLKVITLAITIFAHFIAFQQFNLQGSDLPLYEQFQNQFNILLIISLSTAILLPLLRRSLYIWLILIFRGFIIILISLPLNGYVGVELTLMSSLIHEVLTYGSVIGGLFYTLSILTMAVRFQFDHINAFYVSLPAVSKHDILMFIYPLLLTTALSALLNYQSKNRLQLTAKNQQFSDAIIKLSETNIQLQEFAATAREESARNERKHVAREIHDSLAYTLTNIIMMIEAGMDLSGNTNQALLNHLKKLRMQAKRGLDEVRSTLKAIRKTAPTNNYDLKAIKHLVDSFMEATKIKINLCFGNVLLHFGETVERTVYRLVQEGLTNAVRHGRATEIRIVLSRMNNWINVNISDNGIGCEQLESGYGLLGIEERIEKLGGKLDVNSEKGQGFLLSASIPMEENKNGKN